MIRRFLYHGFWNFYDYLGSYALLGAAQVLLALALLYAGTFFIALPIPAIARFFLGACIVIALVCLFAAGCAGFFPFAWKAAQDLPARWPDFRAGVHTYFRRYLALTILTGFCWAVIAANVRFYLLLARGGATNSSSQTWTVIAAAFGWALLAFTVYAASVFINAGAAEPSEGMKPILRRAFVTMAILPGLWCFALAFWLMIASLCVASHAAIIFVLPGLASATATAYRQISQYSGFLAEAKEHIGGGQAISAYKRKAVELIEAWEARQPRRTVRELLRPWEH